VQQKNLTPKLSRRINGRLQWTYPVQKVRFVVIQSFLNVRFCLGAGRKANIPADRPTLTFVENSASFFGMSEVTRWSSS